MKEIGIAIELSDWLRRFERSQLSEPSTTSDKADDGDSHVCDGEKHGQSDRENNDGIRDDVVDEVWICRVPDMVRKSFGDHEDDERRRTYYNDDPEHLLGTVRTRVLWLRTGEIGHPCIGSQSTGHFPPS